MSKKFTALFLIFSLVMINCAALKRLEEKREKRKKHGANLIIQKINGQQVSGELITVKPNSLLLLNTEGKGVSVRIEEINVITVVKKSKASTGIGIGLLIGGASAAYFGPKNRETEDLGILNILYIFYLIWPPLWFKYGWGSIVLFGSIGAVFGGIIGSALGTDETIEIEGKPDAEIKEALDKLRKKARIRDYR